MTGIGKVQQNMAALIRKAVVDEEFRKLCLADGKQAYLSLTKEEWVLSKELCFIQESDEKPEGKTVIMLPGFLAPTWLG